MADRRLSGGLLALVLLLAAAGVGAQPAQAPAESVDALARDVERLESLRAVKDLQRLYAQYAQAGRWDDAAGLFASRGRMVWGELTLSDRAAIAGWLRGRSGGAREQGLRPGALHTELIDEPLVNLSVDGKTAKGRWMSLSLLGDGKGGARIEGGLYENDYARGADGRWRIAEARYYPQFEGTYAEGWTNVGKADLPVIPMHFTVDEAGTPVPPAAGPPPRSGASLAGLERRIAALNDEDAVRNVQNAWGYYLDRKMWDDAADLFAAHGVIRLGELVRNGRAGVKAALVARMGPAGLGHGELNDRPLFDVVVRVAPDGRSAEARGIELGMLGQADKGQASWEISVFRNRFVKQGGIWKLKDMTVRPVMTADYAVGWGSGGGKRMAAPALLASASPAPPAASAKAPWSLAEARRRLQRSAAWDGSENISSSYGYYIDDGHWPEMGAIFGRKGAKEAPFAGFYRGADRIAGYGLAQYGAPPTTRSGISYHWRIQPVILVSHDGRSANVRTRLFQPRTSKTSGLEPGRSGLSLGAAFYAGMYQDQTVLEDGIWRLWSLALDEPYFTSAGWKGGWSAVKDAPVTGQPPPSPILKKYPPDVPITALGRREEHFRGGVGQIIQWPSIQPMWFPYRNLVSGRMPENFIGDCVPCDYDPSFSMKNHGYQLPPTGPSVDGNSGTASN